MTGAADLVVESVSLQFGGIRALSDVCLTVAAGSLFAVIGPNGAGKTSLFNCLTGYYHATSGTVRFAGRDITRRSVPDVAALGIRRTFQNIRIFPRLSALENVLAGAHLRSDPNVISALLGLPGHTRSERALRQEAREWLDFVNLAEYSATSAGDLSYGVRKRMEIARALIGKPSLLLLDEPAAGVSSIEREELGALIQRISGLGISVVLIEHDVELVMRLASQVVVLDRGVLIADGDPVSVRNDQKVIEAYMGRSRT